MANNNFAFQAAKEILDWCDLDSELAVRFSLEAARREAEAYEVITPEESEMIWDLADRGLYEKALEKISNAWESLRQ